MNQRSLQVNPISSGLSHIDEFMAHLVQSQRPTTGWQAFQKDVAKARRLLSALPESMPENRLSRTIGRLQSRLKVVRLYERDPSECYRAFTV